MPTHLRANRRTTGLLFQFILSDFIACHLEVNALDKERAAGLIKLIGNSDHTMRLICWGHDEGILTKFRQACLSFAQECNSQETLTLHRYVDEAWLICLDCLTHLDKPLSKLHTLMERIGALLVELCTLFRDDENVLYFILRHQRELDALLGESFVKKLFLRLFPNGLKSCSHFIAKRYKLRGFTEFIPEIAKRVAQL